MNPFISLFSITRGAEIPGSARVSRAGFRVLAETNFPHASQRVWHAESEARGFQSSFRRDAETSTRDARATRNLRRALLVALLIPCAAFARTSGISLPSAFTTFTIAGTGGSVSSKFSVNALAVTPDVLWRSASTTSVTAGGTTLTDSTATWTDNLYNGANGTHYLEVISVGGSTSAAGVGTIYTIGATTAATKTLTVSSAFATGVSGTVGYRVRKYWTITSVFGAANSAGLQGGNALGADQVLIWNGTSNSFDAYYYMTGTGWRKTTDAATDAGTGTLAAGVSGFTAQVTDSASNVANEGSPSCAPPAMLSA